VNYSVLPEADAKLVEAAGWYADRQPELGNRLIAEASKTLDAVRKTPEGCSRLEYYDGPYDLRRRLLHGFPYAVIFRVTPAEVLVVAIAHTHRQPLYWIDRLGRE
jgi:plasmid stabilization system protein ParE